MSDFFEVPDALVLGETEVLEDGEKLFVVAVAEDVVVFH